MAWLAVGAWMLSSGQAGLSLAAGLPIVAQALQLLGLVYLGILVYRFTGNKSELKWQWPTYMTGAPTEPPQQIY